MQDEELREKLAGWAESAERLQIPDVTVLRHRARRRRMRRAAIGLVAGAVVAAAVGVVLANLPGEPRPAAASFPDRSTVGPTTGPSALTRTPGLPTGVPRLAGASGAAAWELTATGLSVSDNAGQDWSTVALPAGLAPSSITTVASAAGRGLWLAVWQSPAIELYHQDAGSAGWSRSMLVPQLPSQYAFLEEELLTVSITLAPADVVTVVADWGITATGAYSSLFISSDDGAAFTQHPTAIPSHVWSDTFVSAQQGFIVAGAGMNFLYWTDNGGATWSPVTGLRSSGSGFRYGTPGADGPTLLLPVIVTSGDGAQSVSIYRSTDAGASFAGPTGPPLTIPAAFSTIAAPVISAAGNVVWLPAAGRIYETSDAGATWTTVMTAPSAAPATPISLISPSQAIGMAGNSPDTYLVATTDGGRTWRTL